MKNSIKILIVEDDVVVAMGIKSELQKIGYKRIDMANSHHTAMRKIQEDAPDLILLDISLKGKKTGIDIAYEEEVFDKIPIIYITGLEESQIEKEILPTRPKYYLIKPIRYKELRVAVSLLLSDKMKIVDIGYNFSYDFADGTLLGARGLVHLGKKERFLLERLIEQKGETVSTSILEAKVWGSKPPKSESSLRTLVGNLRKKLKPKMIVNDVGFGYKLPLPKELS